MIPTRNVDESDQASSVDSKHSFGDKVRRKTLFYLISTLNASFYPDYDFSKASPQEFSKEPSLEVHKTIVCIINAQFLYRIFFDCMIIKINAFKSKIG